MRKNSEKLLIHVMGNINLGDRVSWMFPIAFIFLCFLHCCGKISCVLILNWKGTGVGERASDVGFFLCMVCVNEEAPPCPRLPTAPQVHPAAFWRSRSQKESTEKSQVKQSSGRAPGYLPKWAGIVCPHKNLHTDMCRNFMDNCQILEATKMPFRAWVGK